MRGGLLRLDELQQRIACGGRWCRWMPIIGMTKTARIAQYLPAVAAGRPGWPLGHRARRLNLKTAVGRTAGRREASIGEGLRAISAAAGQFQMGDETSAENLKRDKNLATFDGANCGF